MSRTPDFKSLVLTALGATTLLCGSGCSKQAFVVTESHLEAQAPGHYFIPPKVDILLAEDDTGSRYEVNGALESQMPLLLQRLESKGWDYHFVSTPLTHSVTLDQVVASRYDSNWGSAWLPPFPGASADMGGMVASWAFTSPDRYAGFVSQSGITTSTGSLEAGFSTIYNALRYRLTGTNFLRSDAMLVILAVSNGEDTSGVTMCDRRDRIIGNGNDELIAPCEDVGWPTYGTKASSFTAYKNAFLAQKSNNAAALKFYSVTSPTQNSDCLGSGARAGTRYRQMATTLGGESYDICSQSITDSLSSLESRLNIERKAFRTRYLFIESDAEVSTIKVLKYADGGSTAVEIPQDATHGWTYAGYVENVYSIDSPIEMNRASGYAIELHGTAKLVGSDRAEITYKPAGAVDAAAH